MSDAIMPNIRRQIVGPLDDLGGPYVGKVGVHITASNGLSWTVTSEQVLAIYAAQTGDTVADRKAKAIAYALAHAAATVGNDYFPADKVTADFDEATGEVTMLDVES